MPVKCELCNKIFSQKYRLVRHERTHTGDKPYECDVCNKRFTYAWNLIVHERTHTGAKPYECDICNKRFSQSSNLTVHKRIHSGDKPYECDVCKKRFTQLSHLTSHKRTRTGVKPYECINICNKTFSQLEHLATHKIRIHKSLECTICKKIFKHLQSLKRHRRLHLKDGLLLCNTCGREIIQSQGHTNEMSSSNHYDCDECDEQFPDLQSLKQHKAKDHGTSFQCDMCQELEAREPTGIGYMCCVCDVEFDIATQLENHMKTHDNELTD